MTSLEFQPIRCVIRLCNFGRTLNGYVATWFILLTSTAESSATSGYVVVPERFGQSEARAGRKVGWTRKSLVLFPAVDLIDAVCNHVKTWTLSIIHIYFILSISSIFDVFSLISSYGNSVWSFVHVIIYCVGAGITTLMSISDRIDPYFFSVERWKRRGLWKEKWMERCFLPPESAFVLCKQYD